MLAQDAQDREVGQRLDGVVLVELLELEPRERGRQALGARQDPLLVIDVKRRPEMLGDLLQIRLQAFDEALAHRHDRDRRPRYSVRCAVMIARVRNPDSGRLYVIDAVEIRVKPARFSSAAIHWSESQ